MQFYTKINSVAVEMYIFPEQIFLEHGRLLAFEF